MRSLIALPLDNAQDQAPACLPIYITTRIRAWSRPHLNGLLAALVIIATGAPPPFSAYGIGRQSFAAPAQHSSGRKAVIEVRTPPAVYLPGPTFRIQVTLLKPVTPRVPELLQQTIEQTLLRNDPRLRVSATAANTLIECTITDLAVSPAVENRTKLEYRKTGETTVTDPTTGMTRTEDQYSYVNVPYRALVFEGRMGVKCEVTDLATGIVLYSDKFDAIYTDAREVGLGSGAQSVDDLNYAYLKLADNAAGLILAQLSPRSFSEVFELPSGKLKDASKLLESGLWSEALAFLSSMPSFKDPKDDAYRIYGIGIAHEALAYKALDQVEKKRQLELAVENYRKATELKHTEDIFWPPKYRAESVLWQTKGLVAQIELFEEMRMAGSKLATAPDRIAAGNTDLFRQARSRIQSARMVINNQTVVDWVKSGRSSDYIAASIKHAPKTQFDLSDAEVLKLRREGVNKSVLKAMTKSQQGYRPGLDGRTRALITIVSLLWWLPLLFGRK